VKPRILSHSGSSQIYGRLCLSMCFLSHSLALIHRDRGQKIDILTSIHTSSKTQGAAVRNLDVSNTALPVRFGAVQLIFYCSPLSSYSLLSWVPYLEKPPSAYQDSSLRPARRTSMKMWFAPKHYCVDWDNPACFASAAPGRIQGSPRPQLQPEDRY